MTDKDFAKVTHLNKHRDQMKTDLGYYRIAVARTEARIEELSKQINELTGNGSEVA